MRNSQTRFARFGLGAFANGRSRGLRFATGSE